MFSTCAVWISSHQPHVAFEHLKYGSAIPELEFTLNWNSLKVPMVYSAQVLCLQILAFWVQCVCMCYSVVSDSRWPHGLPKPSWESPPRHTITSASNSLPDAQHSILWGTGACGLVARAMRRWWCQLSCDPHLRSPTPTHWALIKNGSHLLFYCIPLCFILSQENLYSFLWICFFQ